MKRSPGVEHVRVGAVAGAVLTYPLAQVTVVQPV